MSIISIFVYRSGLVETKFLFLSPPGLFILKVFLLK